MSFAKSHQLVRRLLPEMALDSYSAYDGTIEFYGRVRALAAPNMTVLDFGAGRGAWFEDEESHYRRSVRLLRGHVSEVIGCDIDEAVLQNRAIDRALVVAVGSPLPIGDLSIDMIVSDYVFEHVEDTAWLAREFRRVLKPGGWICARTPTRNNYVSVIARLIANVNHARLLRLAQPGRKAEDVFPTVFRLNARRDIMRVFGNDQFTDHSYIYCFEPQYHFGSALIYRLLTLLHWLLPASLHGNLFVFLQKAK
jgi:ubiquinone/menaquinone biosynthesis C-methylase UbiE